MAATQKFLFENDFAHPEETLRRAAVYTEDDMQAAKAAAFEEGRAAKAAEQEAVAEERVSELLSAIVQTANDLRTTRAADMAAATERAGALAVSIARKVLPTLAGQNALTEIEGLIARTVAEMQDEPRLVVRVADAKVEEMQLRFDRVSEMFNGALVLMSDDELAETDCRLQWADGGADRDLERLWNEIDAAVAAISDEQTQPEPLSPLEGLIGDTVDDMHPSPPPAADNPETLTANQESGHG